eukprot:scaffold7221_cov165-Amphora_coffeaeformis.AAC.8
MFSRGCRINHTTLATFSRGTYDVTSSRPREPFFHRPVVFWHSLVASFGQASFRAMGINESFPVGTSHDIIKDWNGNSFLRHNFLALSSQANCKSSGVFACVRLLIGVVVVGGRGITSAPMDVAWLSGIAADDRLLVLVIRAISMYRSILCRVPVNCRIKAMTKQTHVTKRICLPVGNFRRWHGVFVGGFMMFPMLLQCFCRRPSFAQSASLWVWEAPMVYVSALPCDGFSRRVNVD